MGIEGRWENVHEREKSRSVASPIAHEDHAHFSLEPLIDLLKANREKRSG